MNATIEAASAGEAGKGFAVVASEVKILARQVALAIAEIDSKMRDINATTSEVVSGCSNITQNLSHINALTHATATTVGDQSSKMSSISEILASAARSSEIIGSNVAESSSKVNEITMNVLTISSFAQEISEGAGSIRDSLGRIDIVLDESSPRAQIYSLSS